jgi:serine/threonine-protein kinase
VADNLQREADSVLQRALELTGGARVAFLDTTCPPGTDLRRLVDRLLAGSESESLLQPGGGASGPLWDALAHEYAGQLRLEQGDRLGVWQVVRQIGRGGMATVYLCERADGQFEQRVALKVLDAAGDFDELAGRFAQERQILATLGHPNIARLIDGGLAASGQPYVVMEFVDGEPIDAYCDRHRLGIEPRIRLFMQVAEAVQYAHGHLVVHRDIKPSNILVDATGQPKLLDFGIAKLLDPRAQNAAPETRSALHPMTPEYASPEQVRGQRLTTACDVYQLGYLLYRLLTGCTPYQFDRADVAAIVHAICNAEPTRPSQAAPGMRRLLRGDLDNILLTALRKEPERRYASVLQFRDDLQRHLDGRPVTARPATLRYLTGKFARRNRAAIAAAALLATSLTVGFVATAWQSRVAAREAQRAAQVLELLVGLFEGVDPDVTLGQKVTAKELLDRGVAKLNEERVEAPLRAEMLGVTGRMYRVLGLYKEARPLLEEARSLQLAQGSTAAEQAVQTASDLAWVLNEQSEHAAAEALAREVVAYRREHAVESPSELSNALSVLALFISRSGDSAEADSLFAEALAIDRRGEDRAALATHLGNLGTSLWRRSKYDEARRANEEALAIQRELHGQSHTRVANALQELAMVLTEQGEFPQSEKLLREALQIQVALLGEGHPETARTLNNLGDVLGRQEKFEESEIMQRRALAARRAAFGDDHISIFESMNNLAALLYFRSRYAEAAELFEQILPRWRKERGDNHQEVLTLMNNLGAARRQAGNYAAAEPILRETLVLRRQKFGDEHRDVAQSFGQLGQLLHATGQLAEAESHLERAIAIWQTTLGKEHFVTGGGLVALGKLLLDRRDFAQAETLLREGLRIRATALPESSVLLAETRMLLGASLVETGKLVEAESLIAASLPVLQAQWGNDHPATRRAMKLRARLPR